MQKLLAAAFLFLINFPARAQLDTLSTSDKAILDSLLKNDAFLQMMKQEDKNYIDLSVGIGNGSFSSNNQAANATGLTNQLIFTPAVAYHFKSGIALGITAYLVADSNNKADLYQTGLTISYDHSGKKINTGISYTRFLSDRRKYNSKSIYQNDFFGYIKKAKGVLRPGLSMGFANGKSKAVELIMIQSLEIRDSTNNISSYFSISGEVDHEFNFYKVFAAEDQLSLTPSIILNAGSDKLTYTHTNKALERNRPRIAAKRFSENNLFRFQSLGFSFDALYGIGKFYFQPNLYLDYYLPSTTARRLTSIYSITAGISL